MESSDESNKNFFKHVFNFDDESKADVLNIIQYAMISLIPVILLNKSIQKYVPEADDQKGSLEVLAEIVVQVIVMFTGLFLVHRMATFLPTYSGVKYPEFSIIFIILAVLMIALSLQTKLGEKVSILTERVSELWEGKSDDKKKKKGNVKVSQPISQNGQMMNQAAMNQAIYTDGTSINSLPTSSSSNEVQQMPNYDAMHRQDTTPLVNAATPSMEGSYMEPMAANSALGGFGGFSAW
jgi:hypothetical protein